MRRANHWSRTQVRTLREVIGSLARGEYALPDFQRPFVWTPEQVDLLAESLRDGLPFGPLLLWERWGADDGLRFDFGGIHLPPQGRTPSLVIDGQQRLAALAQIFLGRERPFLIAVCKDLKVPAADLISLDIYTLERHFGAGWNVKDPGVEAVILMSSHLKQHEVVSVHLDADAPSDYVVRAFVRLGQTGTPMAEGDLRRALESLERRSG